MNFFNDKNRRVTWDLNHGRLVSKLLTTNSPFAFFQDEKQVGQLITTNNQSEEKICFLRVNVVVLFNHKRSESHSRLHQAQSLG